MCRAGIDASHDALFARDALGIDHLQRCFDKLRERRAEKFFLPFVSCERPDTGKQVAAFSESSLQREVLVVASLAEAAVESVGICKFRDELVAEGSAIAGFSSIVLSKSAVVLSNLLYFKPNSVT